MVNDNKKKRKLSKMCQTDPVWLNINVTIIPEQKKLKRDDLKNKLPNLTNFFNFTQFPKAQQLPITPITIPCPNTLCNHKEDDIIEEKNIIKICTINDLIELGDTYHCIKRREWNAINLFNLSNIREPLTELNNMVGINDIKQNVIHNILYLLQIDKNKDMLHTIIYGPPGVGKTHFGKILGKIYYKLGFLKNDIFRVVTRSDLIAEYLGQTAVKTQAVVDSCKGGVLFIDEAYSLGNNELRDSFAKECIDTINYNLTERRDFVCLIAGYKDAIESCFFGYNSGLKRRFSFCYEISGYTVNELSEIFIEQIKRDGWKIHKDDIIILKEKIQRSQFPNFAGDIETFYFKCKIAHYNRAIFIKKEEKMTLNKEDIINGYNDYVENRKNNVEDKSLYFYT